MITVDDVKIFIDKKFEAYLNNLKGVQTTHYLMDRHSKAEYTPQEVWHLVYNIRCQLYNDFGSYMKENKRSEE